MYVTQDAACSVPNSSTPVSSSAIAASQAVLTAVQNLVADANSAMAQIVARPDLNAAGQPIATSGAQPVRQFDTAPAPPGMSQILQRWPKMCTGRSLAENITTPPSCYNIPPGNPPSPPLTLPPVGVAAPVKAAPGPAAPAAVPANWKPPTTGNVCMDIQKGYVQQSQVSPEQLALCSEKGYYQMGNNPPPQPLLGQLQAYFSANVGKLPMIPDQPNVPQYKPGMSGYRGMGQASDFSWGWAGFAAAAALGYLVFFNKPGRK
jgi:hypothetical protein